MKRREFVKICSSAALIAGVNPSILAADPATFRAYQRTRLVGADGVGLTPDSLETDECYIFFYPYVGTPCYLIRLGTVTQSQDLQLQDGTSYRWEGGLGPDGRVVAFSAICPHLLTHPRKEISFINYHAEADKLSGRKNVITCCAHGSVFDPSRGGNIVKGPATDPLPSIALEVEEDSGELFAVGIYGANQYPEFFDDFKRELREDFGRGEANNSIGKSSRAVPLSQYTQHVISC